MNFHDDVERFVWRCMQHFVERESSVVDYVIHLSKLPDEKNIVRRGAEGKKTCVVLDSRINDGFRKVFCADIARNREDDSRLGLYFFLNTLKALDIDTVGRQGKEAFFKKTPSHSLMTTLAPSLAKRMEVARPIPCPAPWKSDSVGRRVVVWITQVTTHQ